MNEYQEIKIKIINKIKMKQEISPNSPNIQLKFIKSSIAQPNPKSVLNLNNIYNKNFKIKNTPNIKFKESEFDNKKGNFLKK